MKKAHPLVGKNAIWTHEVPTSFKAGKWKMETRIDEVRVMAVADLYAMVRRSGCAPFVVRVRELKPSAASG